MHTKVFKIFIAIFIIAAIVLTFYANIGKNEANADEQSKWTVYPNNGKWSIIVSEWVSPDGVSYWLMYESNHGNIAMCPRYNN